MNAPTDHEQRVIRVFVSSTFRDMQDERDELVLRIFPQLRRLCEQRGVTWGEVDLRWGITEQQSERGEVLPICLEEIRRCRPFFIGLLGERYGSIPGTVPAELVDREPWLREHTNGDREKSVTELEILHGVLNNPDMAQQAIFYFRDPDYLNGLPSGSVRSDFECESPAAKKKLDALKQRIRDARERDNCTLHENYPSPKDLGQWVLDDFTKTIDDLFPEQERPSGLERERMDHETFAHSRASVYIGRPEYFERLDDHAAGDGPPLIVLGESGGGKSALLSNWALRYREQHPEDFLLLHFVGSSPDSASATGLLRRIMLELKKQFDLQDDVPSEPNKIREAFPEWLVQTAGCARVSRPRTVPRPNGLHPERPGDLRSAESAGSETRAERSGRIVLVLDALNQLEDIDNAPDLGWLPRVFPKNCRVIVSTLPDRSLDAVTSRGWLENTPALQVEPLNEAERRRLIREFLQQHTRDLGAGRTQRLVDANQTSNPLYLRVLLDELRVFGIHEKLNERIDWYLEARDPYELYRKVIERWEQSYADGSDIVRDTLSLLWAARRGLSESEILEALGEPGRPLPRAVWSPLFLAMSDALVSRSGLLTFAHDFLRTAAQEACLPKESDQQNAHRRLAEYFQQQPTWTDRRLDELPWQLAEAQEMQQLHDALTEEACFLGLRERNEYELLGYWLKLKPEFDLGSSYAEAFTRWTERQPHSL